jgi:3-methyladenine DNA glycosylase/8-oxoguanine DNA glycosylase
MSSSDQQTNDIAQALETLAARNARLADLIKRYGPFTPRRSAEPDVFGALARSIIFQQLAGQAASSIHKRFLALFDGEISPANLLAIDRERLRSAGLSNAKCNAVIDLAEHTQRGELELSALDARSDQALIDVLCRVRGIGPWTAQMFMLFELGRLDVWPTGDLAVRKGFGIAFGLPAAPKAKDLEPKGDPYRPYRSILAWYCWRVLDTSL